jgi:hypothetical protein
MAGRKNAKQFDDDDEYLPRRTTSAGMSDKDAELFDGYGIKVTTPLRIKIETLLLYRVDAESIAELLDLDVKVVEAKVFDIEAEWRQLGQPLEDDDRELERGRLIAELRKLKNDVDMLVMQQPTKDNIDLKAKLIDRIVKLRGLDTEKPASADDVSPTTKILSTLGDLSKDDLTALYAVLNEDDDSVEAVASVEE